MTEHILENLLDLKKVDGFHFEAPAIPDTRGRTFGGQFLGQALRAAQLTVDSDRSIHSLHSYFLRPGNVNQTTSYKVETVRDGRGFSVREVRAYQSDKELFRCTLSFATPHPGLEYDGPKAPNAPQPEAVTSTYNDYQADIRPIESDRGGWRRPLDIRYINPPSTSSRSSVTEDQLMWIKINQSMGDDWQIHGAALAYLSDSTLVDHVLLPHGRRWDEAGFLGASLDHSMWFHRCCRADEWLLFEQQVAWTGDGRGLAKGRLFDLSGILVATCVQEGLLRWQD